MTVVDTLPRLRPYYAGGSLGPPPSRADLIGGQCSLQGLWATTSYGDTPIFDPAILWFDKVEDRMACYAAKRAAGDTILLASLSGQYHNNDNNNFYNRVPGRDFTKDYQALRTLLTEALTEGGMKGVWLWCAGDGDGSGPDYNDPGGWTYGYQWLMNNFSNVVAQLASLRDYIVWFPGADGVVPAWQPWTNVDLWLFHARSVVGPTGSLGLHYSAGYGSWSGERDDFASSAGQNIDLATYEGPWPIGPPLTAVPADFCNQPTDVRAPWDQVWQISKRWLGPKYVFPPEQPACDDHNPHPGYNSSTPRGPRVFNFFEYDTYGHVRGLDPNVTQQRRAYLRSLGWEHVG